MIKKMFLFDLPNVKTLFCVFNNTIYKLHLKKMYYITIIQRTNYIIKLCLYF